MEWVGLWACPSQTVRRAPSPKIKSNAQLTQSFPPRSDLTKTIRIYMERDPIVFFSCVIGTFGARARARIWSTRGRNIGS